MKALQAWLWACIAAGWDITKPDSTRWTHDDNMAASALGWMIAQPPNSQVLDLFCIGRERISPKEMMRQIVRCAPLNPICAKAVMVLSALKLQHPNIRFAFDGE